MFCRINHFYRTAILQNKECLPPAGRVCPRTIRGCILLSHSSVRRLSIPATPRWCSKRKHQGTYADKVVTYLNGRKDGGKEWDRTDAKRRSVRAWDNPCYGPSHTAGTPYASDAYNHPDTFWQVPKPQQWTYTWHRHERPFGRESQIPHPPGHTVSNDCHRQEYEIII